MLFAGRKNNLAKLRLSLPYNPDMISGLFRIDLAIDFPLGSNVERAWLRVSFDDPNVSSCEKAATIEEFNRQPVSLVINSHLLRNGPTEIAFELVDVNGRQLGSQNVRLSFFNTGPLARQVAGSLRAGKLPAVLFDCIDSSLFDYDDASLAPWFDRSSAEERVMALREKGDLNRQDADALSRFIKEGYTLLDGPIDEELIDRVNVDLNHAIESDWQDYQFGSSQRLEHLHLTYPSFYQLWTHPRIMNFLNFVFEVPARPCQTLTYVFGSQQDLHQDTVHLTSFPAGYMCGVWIALEDVQNNSGELMVVPGSHRWQRIYMQTVGCQRPKDNDWTEFGEKVVGQWRNLVSEHGTQPVIYRPKKGTVLIWHENLMHGGSLRLNKSLSRRSMVGHYFADGAIVYYDSAGTPGCII